MSRVPEDAGVFCCGLKWIPLSRPEHFIMGKERIRDVMASVLCFLPFSFNASL